MRINRRLTQAAVGVVSLVTVAQLAGCGTILYPSRRGQTGGEIDPGIAILDGVGLLFFIVPGLIAYGVDFTTGAIYKPGTQSLAGKNRADLDLKRVRLSQLPPAKAQLLEDIIKSFRKHPNATALNVDGEHVIIRKGGKAGYAERGAAIMPAG
ncbi:MAG TPA: hypothetical protein VFA86_06380 [Gammaproteobacteria bacterium]|nr:hypothetical protein [Gammaproteobacteria bacterium]